MELSLQRNNYRYLLRVELKKWACSSVRETYNTISLGRVASQCVRVNRWSGSSSRIQDHVVPVFSAPGHGGMSKLSSFVFLAVKGALSSGAWQMGVKASGWRISPFKQLKEIAPKRPIEKAEWFCYGDAWLGVGGRRRRHRCFSRMDKQRNQHGAVMKDDQWRVLHQLVGR